MISRCGRAISGKDRTRLIHWSFIVGEMARNSERRLTRRLRKLRGGRGPDGRTTKALQATVRRFEKMFPAAGRQDAAGLSHLRLSRSHPSVRLQIPNSPRGLRLPTGKPRLGFRHRFTACLADSEQNSCLHGCDHATSTPLMWILNSCF